MRYNAGVCWPSRQRFAIRGREPRSRSLDVPHRLQCLDATAATAGGRRGIQGRTSLAP